jgi:hypothetical protein
VAATGGTGTNYSYAVSAFNNSGSSPASSATTVSGGATLDTSTIYNTVTWNAVTGATGYNIYRTASSGTPASTGYIGTVYTGSTLSFADKDVTATGSAPTSNTAGSLVANGNALFAAATNSPTAFQVENATAEPIFMVGTTTVNLLSYPDFESGSFTNDAAGWAPVSPAGITQNVVLADTYNGLNSLDLSTTAGNGGAQTDSFTQTVTGGGVATSFVVSFYVFPQSAMNADAFTVTLNDGSNHTCSPAAATLSTTGFTRVFCTTTITNALTSLEIAQNDGTARTIYIDSVQLQAGTTPTAYELGTIQLRGIITNPVTLEATSNSVSAFSLLNSSGSSFLTVDTLDGVVQVGSQTANANTILFDLNNYNTFTDPNTCSTSSDLGALYYNTASNAIRGCINGNWEDMVSTSGLGIILFGVVPDATNAGTPGDLGGISGNTNSPCKVVIGASTTQIIIEPCTAYSGGRKVLVAQTTINTTGTNLPANDYANVCLTGTGNQPAILTASGTETTAAVPAWSVNNPILCLATIKATGTGGTVGNIYDIRTFTNTVKTFTTTDTATGLGWVERDSGTANEVAPSNAATQTGVAGVSVAYSGSVSTNTINLIIATYGPQWVKDNGTGTVDESMITTTTTGYAGTTAVSETTDYVDLGFSQRTVDATCTTNANCQYSEFLNPLDIR